MKKIVTLFTILLSSLLFAQQRNLSIEYAIKIDNEEDLFSNNPALRGYFNRAIANADRLSFVLLINKSGSKFYDKQVLITDGDSGAGNPALIFASYSGVVFQFENAIFKETRSLGKGITVKQNLKNNWELHNETKMIDDYLCYKATNTNDIDNGQGKIFKHPVIAWYCPKLPYSYGPNGYSNLPGLILELQVRNVVYGAKKIDLNTDLDFDPSFLKKVKTISLEELNKKLDEQAESWRE
ncbi:MAG: GLPGLI family protein [Flavobacterium sp.]|nr:MAG: GLPGLI family protein [Flavobacterium sp.]